MIVCYKYPQSDQDTSNSESRNSEASNSEASDFESSDSDYLLRIVNVPSSYLFITYTFYFIM